MNKNTKYFLIEKNKEIIKDLIKNAKKFIKIINFQFSSSEIFNILKEKSKKGIDIEIITLPSDSYKKIEDRKKIINEYKELKNYGIKIFENIWEIGDPSLSTTSLSGAISEGGGDKWYSLHGKMLFTEKIALIMSANFTDENLYEVYLKYDSDELITEFSEKYQFLKNLNIIPVNVGNNLKIPGNLFLEFNENIKNSLIENFTSQNRLIIKEYPENIAPIKDLTKGLKITPFDGRARIFLNKMIDEAEDFIYLLSERLFDDELVKKLSKKLLNNNISIKILTGPPNVVRQNVEKARLFFRNIAAYGGQVRSLDNFHAKCWLTDKWLMVGSPNITKMNLGIRKSGNFWRSNTEILFFENDKNLILDAKQKIDSLFEFGNTVMEILANSNQALQDSKKYFDIFDFPSRREAKSMFAKIKLKFKINNEKTLISIARYASKLAQKFDKRFIQQDHIIMGTILTLLKDRSNTFLNMYEKFKDIIPKDSFQMCLYNLLEIKLIEKCEDLYKLNIDTLLN